MEKGSYFADDLKRLEEQSTEQAKLSTTKRPSEIPDKPIGFKDPTKLTKGLKVFIYISIIASFLAIWSGYLEHKLLTDFKNEVYTSEENVVAAAEANDTRQGIIGLIQLPLFLIEIILFLKWVYRANSNVRTLGAEGLRFTPGWSVGWYLVPVANIWKPYQVMKEIFKVSKNPADWKNQACGPILGWWWAFWLISYFIAQASFRASMEAEEIHELLAANILTMISDAVDIFSKIFTIILVSKIFQMQMSHIRECNQTSPESGVQVFRFPNE